MDSSNKVIRFVQHNFRRELVNHYNIAKAVEEKRSNTIILAQEVNNNKDGGPTNIRGFECLFYNEKTDKRIKTATYISRRRRFTCLLMSQFSCETVLTAKILYNGKEQKSFYIINSYLEPGEAGEESVRFAKSVLGQLSGENIIFAGDFNARSERWNDHANNPRGDEIYDLVFDNEMCIKNVGNEPTYDENGSSIVDLTCVSSSMSDQVVDWRLSNEIITSSDHRVIEFNFEIGERMKSKKSSSTFKYQVSEENWTKFDELIQEGMKNSNLTGKNEPRSASEIDTAVEAVTAVVQAVCNSCFPKKTARSERIDWWTDELTESQREMKTCKRKVRKLKRQRDQTRLEQECIRLKEAKKNHTSQVLKASKKSLDKMIHETDLRDAFSLSSRLIKYKRKHFDRTTMIFNGEFSKDEKDTVVKQLNHFFPSNHICSEACEQQEEEEVQCISEHLFNDHDFTIEEVLHAAKKFNKAKSPGYDGLTADICRRAIENDPTFYTNLFNGCLHTGYFPRNWKVSVCKLIPKPGKDDYRKIESWRPIGLLPLFSKVLEILIIDRITFFLDRSGKMSENQFGFTEKRSTTDALKSCLDIIKRNKKKKQVLMIGLDIKGAFDNVRWCIIKKRLAEYGIPLNLREIMASYLNDRQVWSLAADEWVKKSTTQGCIQGSCGGPRMWNIVLNSIFALDKASPNIYLKSFADDTNLIAVGEDKVELMNSVDKMLEKISRWGKDNGLEFAPAKTQYMPFTGKLCKWSRCPVMENVSIEKCDQIKVLGVTFDKFLRFNKHVESVIAKADKIYCAIGYIARKMFGASSDVLRTIYEMAIRPIVTYASPVWADALRWTGTRKKLIAFERKYLLKTAKAYRSVPVESLNIITGLEPIDLKLQEMNEMYEAKKKARIDVKDAYATAVERLSIRRPGIYNLEMYAHSSEMEHPGRRRALHFAEYEKQDDLEEWPPDTRMFFTDGYSNDGIAASAWVETSQRGKKRIDGRAERLSNHSTPYQTHIIAVQMALEEIVRKHSNTTVVLLGNSRGVMNNIANRDSRSTVVLSIRRLIDKCTMKRITLHLGWASNEFDIKGSILADKKAKRAASLISEVTRVTFVTRRATKKIFAAITEMRWQARYEQCGKVKITQQFIHDVETAKLYRKNMTLNYYLTQGLTGHGATKRYLFNRKIATNDLCRCREVQTSHHLVEECRLFANDRRIYRLKMVQAKEKSEQIELTADFITQVMWKVNEMNRRIQSPTGR